MARYRLPTAEERDTIRFLESRFGDRQLRTLLTPENMGADKPERTRLVSRGRLGKLTGDGGRITDTEAERLALLRTNSRSIQALSKRGENEGRKPHQINRAIRSWVEHGRPPGSPLNRKHPNELRAIRSLRFLGIDTDDGTFYVKGNS